MSTATIQISQKDLEQVSQIIHDLIEHQKNTIEEKQKKYKYLLTMASDYPYRNPNSYEESNDVKNQIDAEQRFLDSYLTIKAKLKLEEPQKESQEESEKETYDHPDLYVLELRTGTFDCETRPDDSEDCSTFPEKIFYCQKSYSTPPDTPPWSMGHIFIDYFNDRYNTEQFQKITSSEDLSDFYDLKKNFYLFGKFFTLPDLDQSTFQLYDSDSGSDVYLSVIKFYDMNGHSKEPQYSYAEEKFRILIAKNSQFKEI